MSDVTHEAAAGDAAGTSWPAKLFVEYNYKTPILVAPGTSLPVVPENITCTEDGTISYIAVPPSKFVPPYVVFQTKDGQPWGDAWPDDFAPPELNTVGWLLLKNKCSAAVVWGLTLVTAVGDVRSGVDPSIENRPASAPPPGAAA